MLQRVMIDGIKLPRLYIAENSKDVALAKSKGIPFIRWRNGQESLIKILLRPVLEEMFPHIKWSRVLGPRRNFKTMIEIYNNTDDEPHATHELKEGEDDSEWTPSNPIDNGATVLAYEDEDGTTVESSVATTGERLFSTEHTDMNIVRKLDLADYVGDMSSYVNLEILQRLKLMPAFIGDILECVKLNVSSGIYWSEGYNKRLGLPVGRYNSSRQLPNLIILDVSGSIPRGISATMISLVDTLRSQLTADLIITSSNSRFYPMGSELPSPQEIRNQFGYGNESADFFSIINKHIKGKHYGHVFSFGDNDTPSYNDLHEGSLIGTLVEHVHHYHTGLGYYSNTRTGYAKWCHMLSKSPIEDYDTDWCTVIRN